MPLNSLPWYFASVYPFLPYCLSLPSLTFSPRISPSPSLTSLHWDWSSPSRSASPPKHSRLLPSTSFPPLSTHPHPFPLPYSGALGATSYPKRSLCSLCLLPPLPLRPPIVSPFLSLSGFKQWLVRGFCLCWCLSRWDYWKYVLRAHDICHFKDLNL